MNALIIDGPNAFPGNTFITSAPSSSASSASFIVITPGITGTLYLLQSLTVSGLRLGLTMYFAPASIQALAVSGSSTVPAPMITSSSLYTSDSSFIMSMAPGTVIVISRAFIPPAFTASIIFIPCSLDSALITATTPDSTIFCIISILFIIHLCKCFHYIHQLSDVLCP